MSASITPAELRAAANQPYPHGSGFRVSANRAVLLRRAADALEAARHDAAKYRAEAHLLTKERDEAVTALEAAERRMARLEAVGEAARGFANHVANEDHGNADGVCLGCGQAWPCFVERLHLALAALDEVEP